MSTQFGKLFQAILFFYVVIFIGIGVAKAEASPAIILDHSVTKVDVYPGLDMIKGKKNELTIEDMSLENVVNKFVPSTEIERKRGFFERENWIRFEVVNQSNHDEWILEFAFPLIHELDLYVKEGDEFVHFYKTGADFPFHQREMNHRYFAFNLDIEPGETMTFYGLAVGSGDLHPPVYIWEKNSFLEKTQTEFVLLGIFYGIVLVMIVYNLYLFISLRLKSYIYYVLVIIFTLFGKLSINGLGFQYIWSNYPNWNVISTPFWVTIACICIVFFTREFLNLDRYIPSIKYFFYLLIPLNATIIIMLPISRYIALTLMVTNSFITFATVLITAIICLKRGVRQARYYILGWLIFLTGVFITILERMSMIPYTTFTEYAGQASLSIEVVLLSLALADNINIMRSEKEAAEKKAHESHMLAIKNLQKADELKDEFLAITSHELRTPLYGMIGIAESLREGITEKVSESMRQQLSMIIVSGQRLTHLVNEILDFSKLKYQSLELNLKPVDLKSVVDIVVALSIPLVRQKQIHLINQVDRDLPAVRADKNRLQQILHNLVDNAIKYTHEGYVTISAFQDSDHITIEVTDTGEGIPKDQLQTIFQPFRQRDTSLSRKQSGVGIGLNITKSLVELHHGKLEVESKVHEGTTFRVTLPRHEDTKDTEEVAVTSESFFHEEIDLYHFHKNTVNNKANILIADDEKVNLQVLMNQLSGYGYRVFIAQKGKDVFPIIENNQIDLVILDIMMPGMSGYEVCKKLRQSYSLMDLPILMLTAKNQLKDKMLSFEAGANDYLVKPCDKEELLSRVKTLVRLKTLNQELVDMNLHLEEKVLERTEELKVTNKNLQKIAESRRQLLANIAHELGTPVTLVHNYVQSVQKGLISPDDLRYRKFVKDKINVLNRLIDDLFDLSRLESGKVSLNLRMLQLSEWLEQLFNKCEFAISQENRRFEQLTTSAAFKDYMCFFDQDRTDQLFSNLISNAIKNTEQNTGQITMDAKLLEDDRIMIKVQDNGVGIHEDDLPYIFERFYQKNSVTREQFGTGLGLAIVKQIVQGHKGEIKVESKENEGTTFYVTLPIFSQ